MKKKQITEEMHLEKEWFKQASEIKTKKDLMKFIDHVLSDYQHDYGTVCHAIGAAAVAAAWYGAHTEGITGFQASFVMWDFIRYWMKSDNKCGLRLIDYDNFLYPQYEYKFEKTIDSDTWKHIQDQAKENLESEELACNRVRNHWESIVKGVVPFGYKVED